MVAHRMIAGRGARPLRSEDGEKAAIDAAVDHPRQIHLVAVLFIAVAVEDAPPRTPEVRRRVEMGIEDDGLVVDLAHLAGRRGQGRRRQAGCGQQGKMS